MGSRNRFASRARAKRRGAPVAIGACIAGLLALTPAGGHADDAADAPPPEAVELEAPLSNRVYDALRDGGPALFSPLSLEMALEMTRAAASPDWSSQIRSHLGRSDGAYAGLAAAMASESADIALANALWLAPGFFVAPAFAKQLILDFNADVNTVTFGAGAGAAAINAWVAEETRGEIDQLVDTLPADAALVLTNALYFKADWASPFPKDATQARPFETAQGETRIVPMMQQTGAFRFAAYDAGMVLELPYVDPAATLRVFLPSLDAAPAAVEAMIADVTSTDGPEGLERKTGLVRIPRLSLTADLDLTTTLAQAGLAGFIGAAGVIEAVQGPVPPVVTAIVQSVVFELDEEGTTAAAATAVIGVRSSEVLDFRFVADRPFHLALVHSAAPAPLVTAFVDDVP